VKTLDPKKKKKKTWGDLIYKTSKKCKVKYRAADQCLPGEKGDGEQQAADVITGTRKLLM
jgi:hypothetical protein